MEAVAKEAFTAATRQAIFSQLGLQLADWQDLGGFESFVFVNTVTRRILRLTHMSHRSTDDIRAELEFLTYLKDHGASVCAPLPLNNLELVAACSGFVCCMFEMAPGRLVEQADWQPGLFEQWGRQIGQFHNLSASFEPSGPRRFDWRTDANLDIENRLPASEEKVIALSRGYLAQLEDLPQDPHVYGLIHSDAHAGNFFLSGSDLTFFDFDDACYQWFAFDVATILFSAILQPWMGDSPDERAVEAQQFFGPFLSGYSEFADVSGLMLDRLPLFLKIRELSLYAVIHSHMDVEHLTDWYPIKFMAGRKAALEADQPYLPQGFTGYT